MEIFLTLAGVSLIPILIVGFLPRDKSFFKKGIIRGFGLGIYLMLVAVLLYEGVEESGTTWGIVWFLLGLLVSLVIGLVLKEFHHHHEEGHGVHIHNKSSTYRILISDFFHNSVDGTAIITGFMISPAVGVVSFLGVLGHQILQQIGQHILLVEGGVSALRAILIAFVISLSVFLGFLIIGSGLEGVLLSLSAGIVAWKVWIDLTHLNWDKKIATGFVAGALALAIILLSIPHAHSEEEGHEEEGEEIH